MAEEETVVVATEETTTEPTLTEKVAADEASDAAKFTALQDRVSSIEAFLGNNYNAMCAHFDERVKALEETLGKLTDAGIKVSVDGDLSELSALVEKMHEKMKLLIPMED